MASDAFKVGDLVWARMKGFSAWPAKVVNHPLGLTKTNCHYVFFFGSYDYAWILYDCIFPYFENITRFSKKSRQKYYQEAIIGIANAYQESIAKNEASSSEVSPDAQTDEPTTSTTTNDLQIINEPELLETKEDESEQENEENVSKKRKRKRTKEEEEERQKMINKRLRIKMVPKKSPKKDVKGKTKKQSSKKSGSQSSLKSCRSKDSVKLPQKSAKKNGKGKEKRQLSKKSGFHSSPKSYRSKDYVVSVKAQDYKKIITKEVVIKLERCDK